MTEADLAALHDPKLPEGPDVIISFGDLIGLGDQGMFTTLPQRFSELGYNVYLDSDTDASNPEVLELLWEMNPYVKGLSDKKPNAGYGFSGIIQGKAYEIANTLGGHRGIECVERANGLPPPYSMAPRIYYKPKPPTIDVSNTVLVDYSAVSSKIARADLEEEMRMMSGRFRNPKYLQLLSPSWVSINQEVIVPSTYLCSSIFEKMDFLAACRAVVCSEAGTQMLAAAVRGEHDVYDDDARPEIVCKITPRTHNSRMYCFRGVDYRETSSNGDGQAYWVPSEVRNYQYHQQCRIRRVEMGQRVANRG